MKFLYNHLSDWGVVKKPCDHVDCQIILKKLFCLFVFLGISYIYFGRGLFTLPFSFYGDGGDSYHYYWFLRWWSYALSHPVNFFITQKAWFPTGYNLTQATSILGVWVLSLPLQWFTSTLNAMNIIAIMTPGLAAWTMYLFCFSMIKQHWPAFVSGMLFGFSGYMIAQMLGHLNLTAGIFILPMLAHLIWHRLTTSLGPVCFVLAFALLFCLLFLMSKETAYTFLVCSSLGLFFARKLVKAEPKFSSLSRVVLHLFYAYVLAAILLSPYLFYFFSYQIVPHIRGLHHGNDLLGVFVPSKIFLVGIPFLHGITEHFQPIGLSEQNGYLGLPLIIAIVIYVKKHWQQAMTRYLFLMFCIFLIFSMNDNFFAYGHKFMNDPIVRFLRLHVPMLDSIVPSRIALYAQFTVSIMMALWLHRTNEPAGFKWVLSKSLWLILAMIFLAPALFTRSDYPRYTRPDIPDFFQQKQYQHYLFPNEHVFLLSEGYALSSFYHAYTDFYFILGSAYLGRQPETLDQINPEMTTKTFSKTIAQQKITAIVVTDNAFPMWERLLSDLSSSVQKVGGVMIYRLHPEERGVQ